MIKPNQGEKQHSYTHTRNNTSKSLTTAIHVKLHTSKKYNIFSWNHQKETVLSAKLMSLNSSNHPSDQTSSFDPRIVLPSINFCPSLDAYHLRLFISSWTTLIKIIASYSVVTTILIASPAQTPWTKTPPWSLCLVTASSSSPPSWFWQFKIDVNIHKFNVISITLQQNRRITIGYSKNTMPQGKWLL